MSGPSVARFQQPGQHAPRRVTLACAAAVFLTAIALNYPWELAQSSLYEGGGSLRAMLWPCFVASLGDGGLVVLIWIVGWAAMSRVDWFLCPGIKSYAVMLGTGLAISAGVEWAALRSGRWTYIEAMPRVPGLQVGLVPVAQMLVLPALTFWIIRIWQALRRRL